MSLVVFCLFWYLLFVYMYSKLFSFRVVVCSFVGQSVDCVSLLCSSFMRWVYPLAFGMHALATSVSHSARVCVDMELVC